MSCSKAEDLRLDISELTSLAGKATRPAVKDLLDAQIRALEADLALEAAKEPCSAPDTAADEIAASDAAADGIAAPDAAADGIAASDAAADGIAAVSMDAKPAMDVKAAMDDIKPAMDDVKVGALDAKPATDDVKAGALDAKPAMDDAMDDVKTGTLDAKSAAKPTSYDVQVKNYSWDQSDKFVKIYMTGLKNVQSLPPENVKTELGATSCLVRVENLDGKNHVFHIKETCARILPEKSYHKIKSDMVVVFLAKSGAGKRWSHMRRAEAAAAEEKKTKIDKDIDKDADPSAGLMNMMKKMYDDGDDDMKRTIAKAWTESRDKQGGGGGVGPPAMDF